MSISVSGNLKDVATGVISSGSWVRFVMRGTAGNQPFVAGTALLAPAGASTWYKDFTPDATGAISGSLYSKSEVSVGGQTGVISYGMQIFVNSGVTGPEVLVDASQNININNPNLLSVLPVVAAPTGDSTYARLDAANTPFTGAVQTKTLNKVRYADQYAGATADVKIVAAMADLPSGGTVSCYGFGATTQTIAATITVPGGISLLFDDITKFQAATSALNLFIFQPEAIIRGFTFDGSNQPSYSGILFQNDTSVGYGIGSSPFSNKTTISDVNVLNCQAINTGTALKLNSNSSTTGVFFCRFPNWNIRGLLNAALLTSSNSGSVNGNKFPGWTLHQSINGIHITTGTSGNVDGNRFSDFDAEAAGPSGNTSSYAILFDGSTGTSTARHNQFYGVLWDFTTCINFSVANATANLFIGQPDGLVNDVTGGANLVLDLDHKWLNAPAFTAIFGNYQGPVNIGPSGNTQIDTDGTNQYYKSTGTHYFYSSGVQKAAIDSNGKLAMYGAVSTVSGGVPAEYATVDLTAQGAAISATTLYAVPAAGAGMYRISYVASITRAGSVSSTLGGANGFQITYTDANDSVVKTSLAGPTSAANTTATLVSGAIIVNAKASTNVQYLIGYTDGGGTTMQYNLHVKLEAM